MENFNNQVMEKLKEAFNSNCTKDIKGNIIQKLFIDTHNIDIFYKLKDYFLLYKKVNEDEPKPETFAYYFFAYFLGFTRKLTLSKSNCNVPGEGDVGAGVVDVGGGVLLHHGDPACVDVINIHNPFFVKS